MGDRHLSAQQLEFLKEAYRKNLPFEHGGHTLDLIDADIVKRFSEVDKGQFEHDVQHGLDSVRYKLEAQKAILTDAFVDGEKARVRARGALNLTVGATSTSNIVESQKPTSPKHGDAKAAFYHEQTKRQQYEKLNKELEDVNQQLEKIGNKQRSQEKAKKNHGERHQEQRRRRQKVQHRDRSELEKEIQRIDKHRSHQFHIEGRFLSSSKGSYEQHRVSGSTSLEHGFKHLEMTEYADNLARTSQLRGRF